MLRRALAVLILHPKDAIIIHGDARPRKNHGQSYDRLAGQWGTENGAQVIPVPADWEGNGLAAGPIRNRFMLDQYQPQVVIAFPGGPGTRNMIEQARRARVVTIQVVG